MERPPASELQKQALWLFGVLVGLAIKEAITDVYDDILNRNEPWGGLLEATRLVLFFVVILRFYLGAIQYFNAAYSPSVASTDLLKKRFGTDFVFGLMHFTMFCFWGLSATVLDHRWALFPTLLAAVLLYDIVWYLWSVQDTRRMIRIWAVFNAVTAAVATIAFGVTAFGFMCLANNWRVELTQTQGAICEAVAYIPVIVASAIDLGGLVYGREGVEEWLGDAIHRPKILGGGQSGERDD